MGGRTCRGAGGCETGRAIGRAVAVGWARPHRPFAATSAAGQAVMGPGVPRERGQLRNGTRHRAGGCQEAPTAEAAAGSRSSGKHTRRRTVRSPNAVAATGVRGLPVRGFVTKAGPSAAGVRGPLGAGRRWCTACRSRRGAVGLNAKRACNDPSPPAFLALDLTSAESRQDSRPMHDSRGQCGEKGPSLARYARDASSNSDLQRFSDAWRANIANAGSFWIHSGDMLPGRGAFPVRGPFGDA